jgi:hypothetical protein
MCEPGRTPCVLAGIMEWTVVATVWALAVSVAGPGMSVWAVAATADAPHTSAVVTVIMPRA